MKKVILLILIVICIGVLSIWVVSRFQADSNTATSSATITSVSANKSAVSSNTIKNEATGGKAEIIIGSGSGTSESTILIPISVKTLPEKGIGSCNFNITYDTNILEAVEVIPDDAAGKNIANIDYSIIKETGIVSFLFTSSSNGKDSITKPGVITNVKFKIKKDAKKGVTKVSNGTTGAFGDVSLNKINVVFTAGEITIN
jgi:hypothetical protein